jgi:hypothetical protein
MVSAVLGALPSGFDLRWLAIGAIAVTTVMSTLILTSMRKRYVLALRSSIDRRKLRLADAGDATGVGDGATADATLDADAIAALREELETQDPSRATLAAELLGTARTIPAALALIEATEHASTDVRTHATDGLGDVPLGDASTDEAIAILDALCDRLQRDPVVAVRRAAARGLRVQLGRLRRGGSAALRDRARKGLRAGRSDTHRDVRAICTVAETEDDVRSGASTRHALVELLHAPDFETREAALTAVSARLGRDREIRAAVREALADENHDVRMQALRTVTRARIDALLPAIAPLLVDARDAPAAIAELSSWGDDALSVASRALPSLPASRLLDWKGDAPLSRVGALASESRPISRLLEHDSAAAALSMRHSPAIPRAVLEPLLDRELTATERLVSCLVGVARDASVERPPFPAPFASLGHELTLRLDDGRARILRLLALAESRRLADLVRVGLREASGARRAHALELLESTLERALARRVVPLFERTDLVALREVLELRGRLDADAVAHPLKALRDLGDVDDPLRTIAWMAYSSARDASAAIEPTAPTEPVLDGERAMIPLYERMLFLRRVALLADLGIEDLRRVAEIVEPIELTAGNKVFCRGEPGEDLYLVSSGAIALRDEAGAELARHHEGETFGELSVLDQEPRTEDAICVEGATVLRLRGADFAELMAQRPRIQEQVMRVLVRKLRALERR